MVYYPVKFHNVQNVMRMFEDIPNKIKFLPVSGDKDMITASKSYDNVLGLGIFSNSSRNGEYFCEWFYRTANVEYEKRWTSFYIPDNKEQLIEHEVPSNTIFAHDDPSRGLVIKSSYLKDISVYRPNHVLGKVSNSTIFDYREIILNCDEIHCMDSSFACYIDHIPEAKEKKKFIHRYIRKENLNPLYKNNWNILDE